MQTIKPNYYDSFTCIADNCPITCCQEWKIAVDDDTKQRWTKICPPTDVSPKRAALSDYVTKKDGSSVIKLNSHGKCPFLNDVKLCKLVLEHGDSILSETCTQFPRQYHTFKDRVEYSLAPCCPEVIRLLADTEAVVFSANDSTTADDFAAPDDFLFSLRKQLIRLMQNNTYSSSKALMMCFYILLSIRDQQICTIDKLASVFHIDTLCKLSDAIDNMKTNRQDTFAECNELFLDLIENYRREKLYSSFLDEAALLAEEYEADSSSVLSEWEEFQPVLQGYEHLFRNYLVSELYSSILTPDSDFTDMFIMVQWIAMEYAGIRQLFFLNWKELSSSDKKASGESEFSLLRDSMTIVSRMMGYDEEDIHEYLNNSFQSLIWDWGYLALLVC